MMCCIFFFKVGPTTNVPHLFIWWDCILSRFWLFCCIKSDSDLNHSESYIIFIASALMNYFYVFHVYGQHVGRPINLNYSHNANMAKLFFRFALPSVATVTKLWKVWKTETQNQADLRAIPPKIQAVSIGRVIYLAREMLQSLKVRLVGSKYTNMRTYSVISSIIAQITWAYQIDSILSMVLSHCSHRHIYVHATIFVANCFHWQFCFQEKKAMEGNYCQELGWCLGQNVNLA